MTAVVSEREQDLVERSRDTVTYPAAVQYDPWSWWFAISKFSTTRSPLKVCDYMSGKVRKVRPGT